MKLMTKEIENKIPKLYAQDGKGDDAIAYVKYFDILGSWSWYATEYDPQDKIFFGLVDGFEVELGYFSLAEFESMGFRIERDMYFKPKTLKEIRSQID